MAQESESRRLILQHKLVALLGSSNVYFQPPKSTMLKFPCIVYQRVGTHTLRADNRIYKKTPNYLVTYITKNPDDPLIDSILDEFEYISASKPFISDNLYHNPYNLYF